MTPLTTSLYLMQHRVQPLLLSHSSSNSVIPNPHLDVPAPFNIESPNLDVGHTPHKQERVWVKPNDVTEAPAMVNLIIRYSRTVTKCGHDGVTNKGLYSSFSMEVEIAGSVHDVRDGVFVVADLQESRVAEDPDLLVSFVPFEVEGVGVEEGDFNVASAVVGVVGEDFDCVEFAEDFGAGGGGGCVSHCGWGSGGTFLGGWRVVWRVASCC